MYVIITTLKEWTNVRYTKSACKPSTNVPMFGEGDQKEHTPLAAAFFFLSKQGLLTAGRRWSCQSAVPGGDEEAPDHAEVREGLRHRVKRVPCRSIRQR